MSSPTKTIHVNAPTPDVEGYFPVNKPLIGTPLFPENQPVPLLFTPIKLREVEFKNRIWVSPMCQYSAKQDGIPTDWHLVHLGGFATRGVGAIMVEATAVVPEGRISPEDLGIWSDEHVPAFKRIVNFVHGQGTKIGIQLAHAGRKASTYAPWVEYSISDRTNKTKKSAAGADEHGWPENVHAPSAIPFDSTYPNPKEMTIEDIEYVKKAFRDGVRRAKEIGFDFIELHFAHGYLGTEFVSPTSNKRTDTYGGSLENRLRFPLEIAADARRVWGTDKPIFARISATEWLETPTQPEKNPQTGEWTSWGIEQSLVFADKLRGVGVDLIDVSSGGNSVAQKITAGPLYQVPFAEVIKKAGHVVGAVGAITTGTEAEGILQAGKADVIFLARQFLRNADWALNAALELNIAVKPANQYERAWTALTHINAKSKI